MRRRLSFAFLLAVVVCAASCRRAPRPNVLVITIDTLRADHLGTYGYALAHTPNIDRLASEGLRCANAIGSAPITMPAHTSIFTGLLPPAHGVRDNGAYALGDDAVTLAERLHDAGYTTHAFVSALVLNRRYNLNQGFETYDDDLWAEDEPALFMIRERQAPKTADHMLAWFATWTKSRQKPFFTWIHFFDPHQPYRPSRADLIISATPYDAEIVGVDRQIGRIVDTLRANGDLDNTLLIITADHGESLGEHGEKTHAIFVYDATVHVPLIVRYPRLFSPTVYEAPVRSIDIMPTVLSILGLPPGPAMDGHSLLESFRGTEKPPELPQYSESLLSEVGFGMAPLFAIREGGYKYIRAPRPELYDLRNDPNELTNIIAREPRLARRLDAELTNMIDASRAHSVKAAGNPMTRETEESLQALGYLAPRAERRGMQGIDPKDGLPLHNELEDARHLAQQKRWDEAEKLLLDVVKKTPRNVSALNVLGLSGIKRGDLEKALKYYRESLAVDDSQFRVYGILGTIAMTHGDLQTATQNLKSALSINPHYAEAMAGLGFIESLQSHDAAAEAWYRKGIAADPSFPRVYRRLGDLYYERGDFRHAYENYTKVIRLVPSDLRAILQTGNCARRLGQPKEAESMFRRAEAMRPDSWIPTYNRACLYAVTGRADDALQTLNALAARHALGKQLVENDHDLAAVRALPGYGSLKQHLTRAEVDEETGDE
jgi:choline-sulfatase